MGNFGGPQPGTSDRYGAALTGVSRSRCPRLALDAAYTRLYSVESTATGYGGVYLCRATRIRAAGEQVEDRGAPWTMSTWIDGGE